MQRKKEQELRARKSFKRRWIFRRGGALCCLRSRTALSGPWACRFLECGRTFLLELNRKRYNRRASASNPLTSHCVRGESTMNRVLLRCSFAVALLLAAGISVVAQEGPKHPITFADMIGMHRVAEPQVSPDGKWVAYMVTTPDMEAN